MKKMIYFLLTKSIGLYLNLMSFVFPKKATQLAHYYFTVPREGKLLKNKLPDILQEAQLETIYHNEDVIQAYVWKGNETVILLVHGWESNSSRWEKMLPYLKKSGSTIIAIDGPGQGLSSGEEFNVLKIAAFMDVVAQKFHPRYIIGHSMGGKASLYYQYKYQNTSIEKMVILGAPSDFKIIFDDFIALLSLNSKITKALEKRYVELTDHSLDRFAGKEFASKITTKGLLVHDVKDKIVLFKEGQKIANAWKEARFIQTSGLGHSLHDGALYEQVYQFLFELE
jgi:esterase/lipase